MQQTLTRGRNAVSGQIYWAVFKRIPTCPIVMGSHYGARVDCSAECDGLHGHVFTSEAAAAARLAMLPKNYSKDGQAGAGAPIVREIGRVLFTGSYYDVVATAAGALAAGDTVNTAGADASAPYWQRIQSIEHAGRVGGREGSGRGADVYRVTWEGSEASAAPSLLSSRQRYDVVTLRY